MLLAAAIAAVAALAAGLESVAGTAAEAVLKVGTYNIRCHSPRDKGGNAWNKRRADLVDLVSKLDFDVFGMQEVAPR